MVHQDGMRWVYGEYRSATNARTGVFAWMPYDSIFSSASPPNGGKSLACNYGPIHQP